MNNKTTPPTYPVEYIEAEVITLDTLPLPRITRSRFQQFIDNVALAIITGSISEETVYRRTTPAVFQAIRTALARFDEMNDMYSSRSTLGGVNEYLDKDSFNFSNKPNGYTRN